MNLGCSTERPPSPVRQFRASGLATGGLQRLSHFYQRMQRFIDSRGVWKNGRNLRIKHHDVRACFNPLVVFTSLKPSEVGALVLRAKFIRGGLSLRVLRSLAGVPFETHPLILYFQIIQVQALSLAGSVILSVAPTFSLASAGLKASASSQIRTLPAGWPD